MKNIMNEKLSISESNPIHARHYDYDHFTYPWHFHSQYEIIYVKESTGLCFVGDCIEAYSDEFFILLGSNLPHYMRSSDIYKTGNKDLRVKGTIIQFEKDFMLHSINYYPQFLQIKMLLEESRRGICFPKEVSEKIGKLVEIVPNLQGIQQITDFLLILQNMAISEKKYMASSLYYETFPSLGNKRIEKIISFINDNYTRDIDLKEIASMSAMNPSAFCRYFKENTGKTFTQYVTDMRIGHACKLLSLKEMNIAQICMECGFESISHFNRTFKQITRFTPTQYQQNILK
ncbi:Virulence regulon transcriptional activator VirF [termite gut metagenome]|uniref:Virulence regulon transcriptional activator VirF n=1 Tax=termite gut metagenome TaxID=433724 RepID=A0A5J4SZK3_9ZZZZ